MVRRTIMHPALIRGHVTHECFLLMCHTRGTLEIYLELCAEYHGYQRRISELIERTYMGVTP